MTAPSVQIVAILNITPDSYVAESRVSSEEQLISVAKKCVQDGAHILEVGGESTGPGSVDVSLEEELRRVLPAVKAIRQALPDTLIAVDTWKAEVARQALAAGAMMINDITAGRGDPDMYGVIANSGCRYVMMYAKDATPRTIKQDVRYDDVVATVSAFLADRIAKAGQAGVQRERIIIDPGLGHFISADPTYSFEILKRLTEFTSLGPVLVSPSRKSFLAGPENLPVSGRLPATLAATTVAVVHGARFIRTHDVRATALAAEAVVQMGH